ncbi:hypothetical protein [Helicobacter sp. 13S00477-4]|uniref:hypothetical protein n=1 Tax=Helicobacter sp. 13S00477-4 TaxID=1905759 RepID=UPI000BA61975|nr:hypothetical protein [Helicobacter sp. 13S00477-4]PAF51996.1 hypothetical protein BKH44_04870 [Helicobacter sp. 13S00477-4]
MSLEENIKKTNLALENNTDYRQLTILTLENTRELLSIYKGLESGYAQSRTDMDNFVLDFEHKTIEVNDKIQAFNDSTDITLKQIQDAQKLVSDIATEGKVWLEKIQSIGEDTQKAKEQIANIKTLNEEAKGYRDQTISVRNEFNTKVSEVLQSTMALNDLVAKSTQELKTKQEATLKTMDTSYINFTKDIDSKILAFNKTSQDKLKELDTEALAKLEEIKSIPSTNPEVEKIHIINERNISGEALPVFDMIDYDAEGIRAVYGLGPFENKQAFLNELEKTRIEEVAINSTRPDDINMAATLINDKSMELTYASFDGSSLSRISLGKSFGQPAITMLTYQHDKSHPDGSADLSSSLSIDHYGFQFNSDIFFFNGKDNNKIPNTTSVAIGGNLSVNTVLVNEWFNVWNCFSVYGPPANDMGLYGYDPHSGYIPSYHIVIGNDSSLDDHIPRTYDIFIGAVDNQTALNEITQIKIVGNVNINGTFKLNGRKI